MRKSVLSMLIILLFLNISSLYPAQLPDETSNTFPAKKAVEMSITSGDCIIKAGATDKITVDLEAKVEPPDAFKPEIFERGERLIIKERWSGSSRGTVVWTITVPAKTDIEVESASGDIALAGITATIEVSAASGDVTIEKCQGDAEIETASGDITLTDCEGYFEISAASGNINGSKIKGEIELSSASGDIDIQDSQGTFEVETASGDIQTARLELLSESEFSAASGDIEIVLAGTPEKPLSLSTASGDIILDYNGHPMKGRYELTTRKHRGKIEAPVSFDKEETVDEHGEEYVKKIYTVSGNEPLITLETASGDITLIK